MTWFPPHIEQDAIQTHNRHAIEQTSTICPVNKPPQASGLYTQQANLKGVTHVRVLVRVTRSRGETIESGELRELRHTLKAITDAHVLVYDNG